MHTIRPRRVAVLLAVLALLFAAWPAAAAPHQQPAARAAANDAGVVGPLFHGLATWLNALWPGIGGPAAPEATWGATGGELDPNGAPQSAWEELGSGLDPYGSPQPQSDVPASTPQLGSGADPYG